MYIYIYIYTCTHNSYLDLQLCIYTHMLGPPPEDGVTPMTVAHEKGNKADSASSASSVVIIITYPTTTWCNIMIMM